MITASYAYPKNEDLLRLVRFSAKDGTIWLAENRMLLLHVMALAVGEQQGEGGAGMAVDFHAHGALHADFVAFVCGSQFAVERGIVGLPDEVAGCDTGEVDVAMAEAQGCFTSL